MFRDFRNFVGIRSFMGARFLVFAGECPEVRDI